MDVGALFSAALCSSGQTKAKPYLESTQRADAIWRTNASFGLRWSSFFGVDGAAANITYYIGESTGTWSHYNFFNRYVKALSQWAVVFTVILTVLVFAYDVEAFPNERDQKSGRCAGVSPRPLESESGSP